MKMDDMYDSENENLANKETQLDSELLLASLLEEKCASFVKNTADAQQLFEDLCTHLSEFGVLSPESYKDEFSSDLRIQQMEILKKIMTSKAQDAMLLVTPDGNENLGAGKPTEKDSAVKNPRYKQDFQEFERLGKGGFGSVFRVKHRLDDTEYAVKKIRLRRNEDMIKLQREVKALANLKHKNIVGYNASWLEDEDEDSVNNLESLPSIDFDSPSALESMSIKCEANAGQADAECETEKKRMVLYIQMQLCNYNLQEWLHERNEALKPTGIDIGQASACKTNLRIFCEILDGVTFIHTRQLIHRDLKPQNIFLYSKNRQVKIGDFGLVKALTRDDSLGNMVAKPAVVPSNLSQHTKGVGTWIYASPEQLEGSAYDTKSDMYSLGVILYEMYNTFDTEMERIREIGHLRYYSKCSEAFRLKFESEALTIESLISSMASSRPTALEIFNKVKKLLNKQWGDAQQHTKQVIRKRSRHRSGQSKPAQPGDNNKT